MSVKKVTNDFKKYLDDIELLSRPLDNSQKDDLETILSVQLSLLIAFKLNSNLGGFYTEHLLRKPDAPKKKRRQYTTMYNDEDEQYNVDTSEIGNSDSWARIGFDGIAL